MGHFEKQNVHKDGRFFFSFDVVGFFIFENAHLIFFFFFNYDIWYVLGWYQCWAVLTFPARTLMISQIWFSE
jgi:hypothetical protein